LIWRVWPGLDEVRAKVRRPVNAFTRLDLPTLERPAKATSGSEIGISDSNEAAPATNSQGPAKSLRAASISAGERAARRREIFEPYHHRIDATIGRRLHDKRPTVLVSLHSFTPVYAGVERPWHIGALYNRDTVLPQLLLKHLHAESDLVVGDNEPYAVNDLTDYTIPVHGEARGLVSTGIEIRQDLIADQSGQRQWAERLARIFAEIELELRAERLVD